MKNILIVVFSVFLMSFPTKGAPFSVGDHTGNGGDVVVCEKTNGQKSFEVLDFYEVKELHFFEPQVLNEVASLEEHLKYLIKPLIGERSLELQLGDFYQKRADSFFSRVVWTNEELPDIRDSYHTYLPDNCTIKQIAINKLDGRIIVNKDLWNNLNKVNQATLILHELIYEDYVRTGFTDSIEARKTVSYLIAKKPVGINYKVNSILWKIPYERSSFLRLLKLTPFPYSQLEIMNRITQEEGGVLLEEVLDTMVSKLRFSEITEYYPEIRVHLKGSEKLRLDKSLIPEIIQLLKDEEILKTYQVVHLSGVLNSRLLEENEKLELLEIIANLKESSFPLKNALELYQILRNLFWAVDIKPGYEQNLFLKHFIFLESTLNGHQMNRFYEKVHSYSFVNSLPELVLEKIWLSLKRLFDNQYDRRNLNLPLLMEILLKNQYQVDTIQQFIHDVLVLGSPRQPLLELLSNFLEEDGYFYHRRFAFKDWLLEGTFKIKTTYIFRKYIPLYLENFSEAPSDVHIDNLVEMYFEDASTFHLNDTLTLLVEKWKLYNDSRTIQVLVHGLRFAERDRFFEMIPYLALVPNYNEQLRSVIFIEMRRRYFQSEELVALMELFIDHKMDEEIRGYMQQLKHDKRKEVSQVAARVLEEN
jgi:hypothetical protein